MRLSGHVFLPSILKSGVGTLLFATALATGAGVAAAQQSSAKPGAVGPSLEERLRTLEARVTALEGRGVAPDAATASAVQCSRLSVNGSGIAAGATLTVTVNGATVGVFDGGASAELESQMRPGLNIVGLSFASPGTSGPFGTQAELRCLAPGGSSRNEILSLKPSPGRLSAQARVNLVRP